jgi:hypothetical protein
MSNPLVLTDTLVPGGSFAKDRAWHLGDATTTTSIIDLGTPAGMAAAPCAPI